MDKQPKHIPVLLKEAIKGLNLRSNRDYLDCTVGYGGHAKEILKKISPKGRLLGIDQDQNATSHTKQKFSDYKKRLVLIQTNFSNLGNIVAAKGFSTVSGTLFDLGVSSPQITESRRGFSFLKEGELDMRMSSSGKENSLSSVPNGTERRLARFFKTLVELEKYIEENTCSVTAAEIVNFLPETELAKLLWEYGEEKFSRKIARRIVEKRKEQQIKTTKELVDIITPVYFKRSKIHPATRTFQALRIVVNQELKHLEKGLKSVIEVLEPGGRIVVISFHSLEDRIVKNIFKHEAKNCICPPKFPECRCSKKSTLKIITKKPIVPSEEEIEINPLSRSAKLRIAEKIMINDK